MLISEWKQWEDHALKRIALLCLNLLVIFTLCVNAQTLKSGQLFWNDISATIHNRAGISELYWQEGGAQSYLNAFGFLVGGEVVDTNGEVVHIFSDGFLNSANGDFEPGTVDAWGWLPLSGFDNPAVQSIALSDDPGTWPGSWQAWPYEVGSPSLISHQALSVMTDSANAEFDFFPQADNPSLRGLGLQVTYRAYQWVGPVFRDILLLSYDIENRGDNRLDKLVAGFFADPSFGGAAGFADEKIDFAESDQFLFAFQADSSGEPHPLAGYMGITFLDTPDDKGITSVTSMFWGGENRPRNDALMWSSFMPGERDLVETAGDRVFTIGSGYFALNPGESKTLSAAIFFGSDFQGLQASSLQAYNLNTLLSLPESAEDVPVRSFHLAQNFPNPFNPHTTIRFYLPVASDVTLEIFDLRGRLVTTLFSGQKMAGWHDLSWAGTASDGQTVAGGVYFYRMISGAASDTRKMLLLP